MKEFTKREMTALIDAAQRPGGWAGWGSYPKTTVKLAERGFFTLEAYPKGYGMRYRLTQLGRAKAWWGRTK